MTGAATVLNRNLHKRKDTLCLGFGIPQEGAEPVLTMILLKSLWDDSSESSKEKDF